MVSRVFPENQHAFNDTHLHHCPPPTSGIVWKNVKCGQIWAFLRDEFQLTWIFVGLDFKLTYVELHNIHFLQGILPYIKLVIFAAK
ncbi:hypothetical protein Lser_V15G23569 [Lactuca serriola]